MRAGVAFLVLSIWTCTAAQETPQQTVLFQDDFSGEQLDAARWVHTVLNDFEAEIVDLVNGRLRMAAATVGTDDATVKFHGLRTTEPVVDLSGGVEVGFNLDWNNQANGCYMTAGAYLCPTVAENPRDEPAWVGIQYIGVPPGKNGRCAISVKRGSYEQRLLTENWPEERTGRPIGLLKVQITLDRNAIAITENGQTILEADGLNLDFDKAYLYLQHTSHSNYRTREVFFDNVVVNR